MNWEDSMPRPELFPAKKVIGFERTMLTAIDAYRRDQTPIPNVSDAIRAIIRDWLIGHGYLEPGPPREDAN
jgi:hypothetical protein